MMTALPKIGDRLTRNFYQNDPVSVARSLLGKPLLMNNRNHDQSRNLWTGGIIVETEAYLSDGDPASHSARGRTPSNTSMFAAAGTVYVYPIHSRFCFNVSTEGEAIGSAVLIRAIEPVWQWNRMVKRRGLARPIATKDERRITSGPGMVCEALDINRIFDGMDLTRPGEISIINDHRWTAFSTTITPRIGVTKAMKHRLRFFVDGNFFVSGRASDHKQPRQNRFVSSP